MKGSLAPLFAPRSVAVVGASRDPSKVGGSVLANLRAAGFEGRIVPINARADAVQGLPAAASLLAVDGDVDLAVVAVPAAAVLPALKECAAKGVGAAVVISAGFREAGPEGRAREAELAAWLRDQPLRVLGPNCLGWIRPSRRLNVTFAPGMPLPGGIAFVSHSGALATAILDWARDRRLGFSLFASLGNQVDLTEADVLAAVADDPETRVIAGYVEGVADGRRFFEALRRATALKPVVLLKAGRSAEGARAVAVPHRRPRRLRSGLRCRGPTGGRRARAHGGGALRRRPRPREPAAAAGPAAPGGDERRRPRDRRDRRRARGGTDGRAARPGGPGVAPGRVAADGERR